MHTPVSINWPLFRKQQARNPRLGGGQFEL
jgi:hypothetical protein